MHLTRRIFVHGHRIEQVSLDGGHTWSVSLEDLRAYQERADLAITGIMPRDQAAERRVNENRRISAGRKGQKRAVSRWSTGSRGRAD